MLAIILALALAATPATPRKAVAARVGSDVITVAEVVTRMQSKHLLANVALDELVGEALAAELARSERLGAAPGVRDRLAQERRRLAAARFLREEIDDRIKVTDADLVEAFHARNDEIRMSMVIRATEQEARESLQRLKAGVGMIEEATRSSEPTLKSRSGVLPLAKRAELPPQLAQAAFAATIDAPSGPVHLDNGFAVFIVHERKIGNDSMLRHDAPEIRGALEQKQREQLAQRLLRKLRAGAHAPSRGPALSDEQLVTDAALRRGFDRHPDVVTAMRSVRRGVLARAFAQRVGDGLPAVSDADVAARYRDRSQDFWVAAQRECVVLDARNEADAQRLRSRLVAGEDLEAVARDFAMGAAKPQKTSRFTFTDPDLDKMSAAPGEDHALAWTVRRAKTDEWTTVDSFRLWHVIRCDAARSRHRRPLEEVRGEIADAIRNERTTAQVGRRLEAQRRVMSVKIYDHVTPGSGPTGP